MKQEEIEQLAEKISIDRAAIDHARILADAEAALEKSGRPETAQIRALSWNRLPRLVWAGGLAAALLIIVSSLACFVLSGKNADLRDELEIAQRRNVSTAQADETTTINFYLKEHQDTIARYASQDLATSQPVQMHIDYDDIMYYELLDDDPEFMSPGIIFRGPSSQNQTGSPEAPVISNGHTLTLSEARKTAGFDVVSPLWFHPGYSLDQIRRIEDRDTLQLLYTDGISSVSLFEQPLNGQRGLSKQDFREYAVYQNTEQAGGIILAWRDDELSYVLIGNNDMSQLMNMAQSISAGK